MVFFKKFFKSKDRNATVQEASPADRQKQLDGLRSDDDKLRFIRNESSAELRLAAVARLTSDDALNSLLQSSDDAVRTQAKALLLQRLLPAAGLSAVSDTAQLVRIAALTDDNALRLEAIGRINDEDQRLQLAMDHPVARVRAAAAEGISRPELLQRLQDHAQGKDKTLYRMAKDKLSSLKSEIAEQQARAQAVDNLLAQARYLTKVGYHPEFNGKLQLLSQQWPELQSSASSEQSEAITAELAKAAAILKLHADEENRLQAEQELASKTAEQQEQLLQQVEFLTEKAAEHQADELHSALKLLENAWDELFRQRKPDAEQTRRFENQLQALFALHSALQQAAAVEADVLTLLATTVAQDGHGLKNEHKKISQWLKAIHWPESFSAPHWLPQLHSRQQQIQEQQQKLQQHQQDRLGSAAADLKALSKAVDDGHLREAGKLATRIQNALRQIEDQQSQALQREFRALIGRLQEMRDWAGFATHPKKEALVAAMEALVGADIAADVLADKIHNLQEEWKALGAVPGDNDLWTRFKEAGDKAFEPCRAYFAEIADLRERNVQLREQLISELNTYETGMNWAEADWKVVQKTLDTARQTFRDYSPVERNAHKDTQTRFGEVCDRIYGHLKAEYDSNLAAKSAIVAQAEALAAAEDLSNAANQVKELQAAWKTIGVTPRGPDQKLWQQFRKHCDAVFARLNASRDARRAELDETVAAAEALVARAEALTNDVLDDAEQALAQLQEEFAAIMLPKGAHQRLSKQLKEVSNALRERRQQSRKAEEAARWNGLIARVEQLHAADDVWADACALALPDGYRDELFAQARGGQLSSEDQAQDLCILMEIVADAASPDSDRGRRMELQVQRLAEGLGKGLNTEQERVQLVERWLAAAQPALTVRFVSALKASL